jgi:hypothetical protein
MQVPLREVDVASGFFQIVMALVGLHRVLGWQTRGLYHVVPRQDRHVAGLHAGGHYPRWRRDGKELFFLRADNASVMDVDLDLKQSVPRIGIPKPLFPVQLSLLSYVNRLGSAWDPFEVAADGKRFLVNSPEQPQVPEPINVVVNWDTELKK